MREIRLPEGLHVGHAVRPPPWPVRLPYPAKYELGVVFWHAFVRVSTPNVARPPLTINMKGHGRLKGDHNRIYQTYLLSYLLFRSSLPYFSNPMCCSSTTSAACEDVLAGLSSLGQTKVRLPWRGPTRTSVRWSLAGEPGDPGLTAPGSGLTTLRGGAARSSSAWLLAPERRQHKYQNISLLERSNNTIWLNLYKKNQNLPNLACDLLEDICCTGPGSHQRASISPLAM
jgi:hypothetical protein